MSESVRRRAEKKRPELSYSVRLKMKGLGRKGKENGKMMMYDNT
jgi:hypothetical protein